MYEAGKAHHRHVRAAAAAPLCRFYDLGIAFVAGAPTPVRLVIVPCGNERIRLIWLQTNDVLQFLFNPLIFRASISGLLQASLCK